MISNVEVWPLSKPQGNLRARARFTVSNTFNIQCSIMNGKNGLFVSLPSRKGKDKDGNEKYYHDVFCTDKEVLAELNKKVVDAYNQKVGGSLDQGEATGPTDQTSDHVPF